MPIVFCHTDNQTYSYTGFTDPEQVATMKGTRRLAVVNTNGDIERFGFTTNTSATEYCPLRFKLKNSDGNLTTAYLGRSATLKEDYVTTLTHEGAYTTVGAKMTASFLANKTENRGIYQGYSITISDFTAINDDDIFQIDESNPYKYSQISDREFIVKEALYSDPDTRALRLSTTLNYTHVINTQNKTQLVNNLKLVQRISSVSWIFPGIVENATGWSGNLNTVITNRFSSYTYTVSSTREKSTTVTEGENQSITISTKYKTAGSQTYLNGTPCISFTNSAGNDLIFCFYLRAASWKAVSFNDTKTWETDVSRLLTGISSTRPEHFTCGAKTTISYSLPLRHISNCSYPSFGVAIAENIVYKAQDITNPHKTVINCEQTHTELVTEENFNI